MAVTKDGFLKGESIVSRTGVFIYRNADGSERRELRHPDDVFNQDSLDSLISIPVTINHPTELVNSDNAHMYSVGLTGEKVKRDDNDIVVSLTVSHKKAIDAINAGKRELSLGYNLDLLEEAGDYEGEKYTHRQKNINYNHLALVDKARAGRSARINLDGIITEDEEINILKKEEEIKMTQEVHIEKEDSEKIAMQKRLVNSDAVIDELKAELEKLKSVRKDEADISEKVNARIDLITKAIKVTNFDSAELTNKTDRQIMESVIKALHPETNLDSKCDVYVTARFDSLVESHTANGGKIENQMSKLLKTSNTDSTKDKLSNQSGLFKHLYKISREPLNA